MLVEYYVGQRQRNYVTEFSFKFTEKGMGIFKICMIELVSIQAQKTFQYCAGVFRLRISILPK